MYVFIIIIKQVYTIQMCLRYKYVTKFYRIQPQVNDEINVFHNDNKDKYGPFHSAEAILD